MLHLGRIAWIGLAGMALQVGCRDNSPPVPQVAPPEMGRDTYRREVDYPKPLPPQNPPGEVARGPAPFEDEPLLVDMPQEAKAFVEVYRKVGRPRIVVFVNRTLEGQIMPSQTPGPETVTEHRRKTDTGVSVERRDYERTADRFGERARENTDKFESKGPAEYTETTTVFLKPGEYDEADARGIDYGLMENLLADWMSADGQVTIVSPMLVRKKLTETQVKDLQSGRPQAMAELAEGLDADVLIHVQARPTRQTERGLEVRILADAMNVRGGESLARAAVDLGPPMDKVRLNRFTRFLARKLMDGMSQTWAQPKPAAKDEGKEAPKKDAGSAAPGVGQAKGGPGPRLMAQ